MTDATLIIFAKAPVAGQVKTRLIPAMGPEGAARLYRALLDYTVVLGQNAGFAKVTLCCAPNTEHTYFAGCRDRFPQMYFQDQATGDLGARMNHAFEKALYTSPATVLIGSDCPFLTIADLREAAHALNRDNQAVLGPSQDGGYYLLGLSAPAPNLFINMPWSGAKIAALTRTRLDQIGWRWHELSSRCDIDTPEDLDRLRDLPDSPTRRVLVDILDTERISMEGIVQKCDTV